MTSTPSTQRATERTRSVRVTSADGPAPLLPVGDGRRSVPEWIGVTPDTKIPKSVRLRVFARYGGICQLSGRAIRPGDDWDCDHIKALRNGGEHRESNLHPALKLPHQQKTVIDRNETAKTDRMKAKHLGIWPKSNAWNRNLKRKLDGTTVRRNP